MELDPQERVLEPEKVWALAEEAGKTGKVLAKARDKVKARVVVFADVKEEALTAEVLAKVSRSKNWEFGKEER